MDRTGSKADLRKWAQGIDRASATHQVVQALIAWPPIHGVVLSYLPMADEIDVNPLRDLDRCRVVVTRTPELGPLTVHELRTDSLETHRLGFEQPVRGTPTVALDDVDVVLVPGLAFDSTGNRLGRGKGYYDELLSRLPRGVARVGVTVDALVIDTLPTEEHDERVDWVATESGVSRVGDPIPSASQRFLAGAIAAGVAPAIRQFPKGTKTSADAAHAVGAHLGEIAKSILFEADGEPVLVICSGDHRVREDRLATFLGASKVRIAALDTVRRHTGYAAGGTPAVGLSGVATIVVDASLGRYRWVWSASGTPDTVYPVALDRLITASGARWAEVSDWGTSD